MTALPITEHTQAMLDVDDELPSELHFCIYAEHHQYMDPTGMLVCAR